MTKAEKEVHLLARICTYVYGSRWQTELARDLDVNERTVRAWVQGRHRPLPEFWLKIEQTLERKLKRGPLMTERVKKHIATLDLGA